MILSKGEFDRWLAEYRAGRVWFPQPSRADAPPIPAPKVTSVMPLAEFLTRSIANPKERKRAATLLKKFPERRTAGAGYEPAKKRLAWMLADPCAYCGGVADTWDHITPRKRGGDHSDGNLARVCHSCNHEKSTRPLLLFLAVRAQRKAVGTWKRLPKSKLAARHKRQ